MLAHLAGHLRQPRVLWSQRSSEDYLNFTAAEQSLPAAGRSCKPPGSSFPRSTDGAARPGLHGEGVMLPP